MKPFLAPRHRFIAARAAARGFTLAEVVVSVAIAALLMVLGATSLRQWLLGHAVAAQAGRLCDALRIARSEAMKRGGPVVLCKTDPLVPAACSEDARVEWQTWLVFADTHRSGRYEAGEPVIRAQSRPLSGLRVRSDALLARVRFEPTGIALPEPAASGAVFVLEPLASGGAADGDRAHRRRVCLGVRGPAVVVDGDGACP